MTAPDDAAVPTELNDPAFGVVGVDHVGIATADLDRTVALYTGAFGMVEVHRETNTEQQVVEVMLAAAGEATSDGRSGPPARLQLLAPLSPDSAIATFLDRSGPGLQQLALRVVDVAATADRLRRRGLRLLYPEPRTGTAGSKINFVHPKDAGGVLVELVEPAPTDPPAKPAKQAPTPGD